MDPRERLAAYVLHGTFDGGVWSWAKLAWEKPK